MRKGQICPPEVRVKISQARIGVQFSAETRAKISAAKTGVPTGRDGEKNPQWGKKGAEAAHWKGGRVIDAAGYVRLRCTDHPRATSGGYVHEHVLVVEKSVGRFLNEQETIHHLNGDKADNRLENLRLFASGAEHKRYEWATGTYAGRK